MGLLTSKELQRLGRQWTLCSVLAATAAAAANASSAGPAAAAVQRVDALAYEGRDEAAAPAGTCATPQVSLLSPVFLLLKDSALRSLGSDRHWRLPSAACMSNPREMDRLFHSDADTTLSPREGPYAVNRPTAITLRPACCRL